MKIYCEPGNEKYIKWAKAQLARLSDLREDLRVPALAKSFKVDADTLISLKASEFENIIRIFGGTTGGFIIYPAATMLLSPFTTFSYYENQEVMPVKNTKIEAFPGYDSVSNKYRRVNALTFTEGRGPDTIVGSSLTIAEWIAALGLPTWNALLAFFGYTPQQLADALNAAAGSSTVEHPGYFRKQVFSSVSTTPIDGTFMPFLHTYGDPEQEIVLFIKPHTNNPSVYEDGTATVLTSTGSTTNSIDDLAPDGRTGVGLLGDVKASISIDYAAGTKVTKSETTLSGYGTRSEHDVWSYVSAGTNHRTFTETETATYPICFGYSTAGAEQQISIVVSHTRIGEDTASFHNTCTPGVGGSLITTAIRAGSQVTTWTLTMPNGVTKVFDIARTAANSAGTSTIPLAVFDCTVAGAAVGEATASATQILGEVEILYADASVPAVVYRHTARTYQQPLVASTSFNNTSPGVDVVERVIALVGTREIVIDEQTSTEASDASTTYADALPGVPLINGLATIPTLVGYSDDSGDTTTPSSLDTNSVDFVARKQIAPISIAIHDQDHIAGQYTRSDDSTVIFGTGSPRQALIDRLTIALEAKETAQPPTITADEQTFLNNIRLGTLDDYALKLEKASPFGISLV